MKKLSIIEHKGLYELAVELREAVINHDLDLVQKLISHPLNDKGDIYKYYYDAEGIGGNWSDPAGNNLILLAVAQGAHNFSHRNLNPDKLIINAILEDSKNKLTQAELEEFVSFYFQGNAEEYYYVNTPLTLAIQSGHITEAIKLIELGADTNIPCSKNYGGFTPLHLATLRYHLDPSPQGKTLIQELLKHGADKEALDSYNHTPLDLIDFKELHMGELKKYKIISLEFSNKVGLARGAYSFRELMENENFKNFYIDESKNNTEISIENIKAFDEFITVTIPRDSKGDRCMNVAIPALMEDTVFRHLGYDISLKELIDHIHHFESNKEYQGIVPEYNVLEHKAELLAEFYDI